MPKAKQTKKQIVVAKPKPSKPKLKRKYGKARVVRKTGAPTKPNIVKSAASNLAHARWSVTRNEYKAILKKLPANKSKLTKSKPLTTNTKTKTNTGVQPVTNLFDNPYRIPRKSRSTRGKK